MYCIFHLKKIVSQPCIIVAWNDRSADDPVHVVGGYACKNVYGIYIFTALFVYANVLASDKKADVARSRGAILAEIAKYLLLCAAVVGGFLTQYYFVFFVAAFLDLR